MKDQAGVPEPGAPCSPQEFELFLWQSTPVGDAQSSRLVCYRRWRRQRRNSQQMIKELAAAVVYLAIKRRKQEGRFGIFSLFIQLTEFRRAAPE